MEREGRFARLPSQGWEQILTSRKEILDGYDRARAQARAHEVETFHGVVGEAQCRKWLQEFLPKRYGVTSGYVISTGLSSTVKAPHFDVIIHDQLESPIFWVEDNPDSASSGRSLAIPVEHVRAVLEVKSQFSVKSVRHSIAHLRDLQPLMGAVDPPFERYKLHLPGNFICGLLFIELRVQQERQLEALTSLIDGIDLRGFIGGLVLRGEGHTSPHSGRLSLTKSASASPGLPSDQTSLLEIGIAPTSQLSDGVHIGAMLSWGEMEFARFSFDLIALLQGTSGTTSTRHRPPFPFLSTRFDR